ncbi:MAG: two-component sensor histidine kinase [Cryomorphaceae bacterium]|nr:two-component sensor histidine kinase [Cryomorphaceae bacterium]
MCTLFVHFFISEVESYLFFIIPFLGAVFVFIIFNFFLKKFIQHRLAILYRSVQTKQENVNLPYLEESLDEMIENAEERIEQWRKFQTKEILKLKEQEAFRREFLGNLAHELKTPIFSIQGYILTLLEGGLEDDKINQKFLERASVSTDRIVGILDDLDNITKMEDEKFQLKMESFDIVTLAKETFESLELMAQEKNITFLLEDPGEPTFVVADREKIGQVLTNLVRNSIAYGNNDGSTTITIFTIDDLTTIAVSDNGIGIEQSELSRLFERFYRVEKSRTRHKGGSGLGLAIVKHIIESHNQKISVKSTPGIGSQFHFSLEKS